MAAEAIAQIMGPVKEIMPATLAVTPASPVLIAAPVKKYEIAAPANPIVQVQKAVQEQKKQEPGKDVPKKKNHWFMNVLHSIGSFFTGLFSSSKK